MRALVQRVTHAQVRIKDGTTGTFGIEPARRIEGGLVILLGVGHDDAPETADKLWRKISRLRIFADESGKTNRALGDVAGQVLVVSQFTLYASCRKGNRPSFTQAGAPDAARDLYRHFVACAAADVPVVAAGEFGADMAVELENDGPFTLWLDTDEL